MIELETFCFDDVLLLPQYSEIKTRASVDLSTHIGKVRLGIPILSAAMDSVTEDQMSIALDKHGGLGIIHRYNSVLAQGELLDNCYRAGANQVGVAVGVTGDYLERVQNSIRIAQAHNKTLVICIDVAHGHHILVKNTLAEIKKISGDVHIIAGNVATPEGYRDLANWGADSVKIGIGSSGVCSTRTQTGHGLPTLHSVMLCAAKKKEMEEDSLKHPLYKNLPSLIADGGMASSGDITKSLAAGADAVMLGFLLAGTDKSPGQTMRGTHGLNKVYRGSASPESQTDWKGSYSSLEGVSKVIPYKGDLDGVLDVLLRGIRSGFSYSGAANLKEFQERAYFVKQTYSSLIEGSPHDPKESY